METVVHIASNQKPRTIKLHPEIEALRLYLKELNAWPEAGDDFLALMSPSHWFSANPTEQDYEWLPFVVQDAIAGFDIGIKYPAFFHKLLCLSRLRKDFLAELKGCMNLVDAIKKSAAHM